MKGYRVLLLEGIHPVAQQQLQEQGYVVDLLPHSLSESELQKKITNYDALGVRSKTQLTKKILESASDLLAVGTFCIGTNQVDLDCANTCGIPVFNSPYSNTRSVAELVVAEVIALARKLGDCNIRAHKGEWNKSSLGSYEVRGKTLGIVGYGHIGSQVSILAEAIGLKVCYYDIVKKLPLGNAVMVSSFEKLLQNSDFVTLHVPMTSSTENMLDKKMLSCMKKGSYLINASRGNVVDIKSLVELLKSKYISGAAIDVFPEEPKSNKDIFNSQLRGMENVILTPHIGGSTEEAQKSIGEEVSCSLIEYLKRGSSLGAVNFPNLKASDHKENIERILNIHENIPGVLGNVHSIISGLGANIAGESLSTNEKVGYLIIDLEIKEARSVAKEIEKLSTSIRTRIVH